MIEEFKRQWRTGSMVVRLIIINLVVFLLMVAAYLILLPVGGSGPLAEGLREIYVVQWLRSSADLHFLLYRPWTIVTYMFTHTGVFHIFWNMFMLYFGGRLFEDLLGGRRLLGHYLLGGMGGLLLWVILTNLMPGLQGGAAGSGIIGASAGVLSVFVGIAAYQPHMQVNVILIGPVKLMYVAAIFVLLDLTGMGSGDGVAHEAHIGGALYGLMAAQQLKRGTDWSLGFVNALDKAWSWLRPGKRSKLRVEKHSTRSARANDERYRERKNDVQARIDAILDKISRSGYDSLSKEEKDTLFKEGKR